MLEKTEWTIKNGQSRDRGNIRQNVSRLVIYGPFIIIIILFPTQEVVCSAFH